MKQLNFILVFFFFGLLSCTPSNKTDLGNNESTIDSNNTQVTNDIDKETHLNDGFKSDQILTNKDTNEIELGYQETYNKLPDLEFLDIGKLEFDRYKNNYHSKLNIDSSKVIFLDSSFIIKTSESEFKYPNKLMTDDFTKKGHSVEYLGFNNYLKLYVLQGYWVGGDFTSAESFFIDSVTNLKYSLIQLSDFSFETPVFSPNNKYIVTYINDMFESPDRCIYGIIKVINENGVFKYKEFARGSSDLIEDLVWINDYSFAIKINHKDYNKTKKKEIDNFTYQKALLPK